MPIPYVFFAEACVAVDDHVRAARCYELLRTAEISWIVWAEGVPLGPVPLQLAMLARTLGRLDDSLGHFDDALALCSRAEAWPYLARTQLECALTLRRRNAPGDAARARSLLLAARATTERLGMRGLAAKVGAAIGIDPAAAAPGPAVPGARGEREPATPDAAHPAANHFQREGDYWTVSYLGSTVRLRDAKGLLYLACLLRQPGRDFHVAEVAMLGAGDQAGGVLDPPVGIEGDLGPILDVQATASYRQRLRELQGELDAAEVAGDLGRTSRLRMESETIGDALRAAYGLGGRLRTMGDPSERQRKAVTNQIRRAISRIGAAHPALGRHLENAVRTGLVCCYRPEPRIDWIV